MVRLLPKGFTMGLKGVTSNFLAGVWKGMGPSPGKKSTKGTPKPRGRVK